MPHSHHSHSGQFCRHAQGLLEDVVLEAVRQGFEVYGLTEHVPRYRDEDLYPEEQGMDPDALMKQFQEFLDEAHRLKRLYASKITLLIGLETEYITSLDLDRLEVLLKTLGDRVEYIVGSIHHVNAIPIDFDIATYHKSLRSLGSPTHETQERFLCAYFDAQYALLKRFHPEIVGHIDLCRLYDPQLQISDYPLAWGKMQRNINYAIEYGALFEINAAAFRKNWDTAYPATDIVEVVLKHNGRFALSDDSHGPQTVGLNYERLAEYLRAVGILELWHLKRTEARNSAGRSMLPVKLVRDWQKHPFWHSHRLDQNLYSESGQPGATT